MIDVSFADLQKRHRNRIRMRTVLFLDLREISQSDTIVKQFQKEPTLMSAYIMNPTSGKVS